MARLYVDHNVSRWVVTALRAIGHSVVTAREQGLHQAGDEENLLFATRTDRIVVTHDVADFMMLHRAWLLWSSEWGVNPSHPGILVVYQSIRPVMAQEVDQFLHRRLALTNRLYRWRPSDGWTLYQPVFQV